MSQGTENVGSTGRFGPRYGTSVRRRVQQIEEVQNDTHRCPECLTGELDRESTSIWQCRKCGHKFAGGAYQPQTAAFGKAQAAEEELEEIAEEFEAELEEDEAEAEPADRQVGSEDDDASTPTEPEPEEPDEAEPEPEEPDEADEDEEPDSIESLFED